MGVCEFCYGLGTSFACAGADSYAAKIRVLLLSYILFFKVRARLEI